MRRLLFRSIFVCLVFVVPAMSQTVNEAASSVVIRDDKAIVNLVLNGKGEQSSTAVKVELIDVKGVTVAQEMRRDLTLTGGEQEVQLQLPLGKRVDADNEELAWYRLRYTMGNTTGVVSFSQLLRELFELRILAADLVATGMNYRVRVRALHPFTNEPAADVEIETNVQLDVDGENSQPLKLRSTAVTDRDGVAILDFAIPVVTKFDGDGEVKVVGRKGGLTRQAAEDLNTPDNDIQFLSMTDKPIYQPGQLLNLRGVVLKGMEGKTVLGGSVIEFRVQDDDGTLLYREKTVASSYGIASMTWRIPAAAKLGDYRIEIRDGDGEQIGGERIKVSRYDLPNFAVQTKPSKPYYLPSDREAEVEVRADYLFGKPVTKGNVRVVQEKSREWDWNTQKYDINEGEVREGETDAEGKFVARFDLSDAHEELKDEDYDKYDDIKFAAYFTDPTTNKTEQRRFDIRVSREPIHVYLMKGDNFGNSALPMLAYISTFYADGTPVACDVEIRASLEDEEKFKTIGRIKTNSFGGGKIAMPHPKIGEPDDDLDIRVIAKDSKGRRGTYNDDPSIDQESGIRITTDKAIYKPGEVITARVQSTVKTGIVYVDVVRGLSVVESVQGTIKDGTATISIPYSEAFKGELKVAALVEDPEGDDDALKSIAGVIFPARQGMTVDAKFDKAIYKPNDEATVRFGIVDVVGKAVESALGVVIFDKAVEERARTDANFSGMFRGLAGWLGYGNNFGGINVKDLNELDLSKPISDDLQLVAEILLRDEYYYPNIFRSKNYSQEAESVFSESIATQLKPVASALRAGYEQKNLLHPTNETEFRSILRNRGVDITTFHDPWGSAYVPSFSIGQTRDIVRLTSIGPDKTADTDDDFTAYSAGFEYFTSMGRAIDTVVRNYHARTGGFIRDEKTLFSELGVRELLDRYGRNYHVIVEGEGRNVVVRIKSMGPNGQLSKYAYGSDDFDVWSSRIDFFAGAEMKITRIQSALKRAPMTEADFRETLKAGGFDLNDARDGNNNPVFVSVNKRSRYWDKVTLETVQAYGDERRVERTVIKPVTQEVIEFTIKGAGRDGKANTWDDVTLTQVVHVLAEQSRNDIKPAVVMQPIAHRGGGGSIAGTVTDPNDAVVPGVKVTATNEATKLESATTTDENGTYFIGNLVGGTYTVRFVATGFKAYVTNNVKVDAGTTSVDAVLSPGEAATTVDVVSTADPSQTDSAAVSMTITSHQIAELPVGKKSMALLAIRPGVKIVTKPGTQDEQTGTDEQTSTPRLREYFPETLYWSPEIVTSTEGTAEIRFRMADNITTWKMYTIASTKDGRIGVGEKEVAAFQAFFVDLDPPKFLTTGDEIYLPTQVRNYTEKKQDVKVTMSSSDWFTFLDAESKNVAVGSGKSENAVFGFKATSARKDARQRVTAMAETDSDAIERPVTVRPDGREIVQTDSRYFTGSDKFELNFPANAFPDSRSAELKIYPNVMAHVAEAVEGLLRRPYGCGEQTISSTYPNVMILKFASPGEGKPRRVSESVERTARKYLQSGYERLLGYQVADGGFSYWGGKDGADFALTAYALRFLADASRFVEVDPEVIKRAETWLIKQQKADGSWNKKYTWEPKEDEQRAKSTTTFVARTLAMLRASAGQGQADNGKAEALARSLGYLRSRNAELDDPYSLGLFGLAAFDAGDEQLARLVAQKLATLAKIEGGSAYWNLESNTAFNGWGKTGRIETTALVAQLFMKLNAEPELVRKAMLFVFRNKDNYGVWYSTQTTINVLDALVISLASSNAQSTGSVQVLVNGQPVETVRIPADKLDEIVVDLRGKLAADSNTIELRSGDRSPLMTQLVATHYVDWSDTSGRTENQSRALRLDYKCDRSTAAIMQEVSCTVEAERIAYHGYGMLLAEIGTPPGADVSRESLQAAVDADWSISRYDVLPDRIILYMWSKAGGTKLNFKFRPRYGINAKTPASVVYDYYNPEAEATVAPLKFAVK